jgi:peptide/nickel transport system substrate-binding protein
MALRRCGLLTGALLAAMAFTAQALAQSVTIGVARGPDGLDPHLNNSGTHVSAMRNIYEGLVTADAKLRIVPALAEKWRLIDDTTWEFTLRAGAKFHDGSPVTAADAVFSFERVGQVGARGGMLTYLRSIKRTEAVDERTVRIVTNAPVATLLTDLARLLIVSAKAAAKASAAEFNDGRAAVGTGAYRVSSWKPKGNLVLERFADYWGPKPDWQKVTFAEISNDAARVAALLSGRVQLINYVPVTDVRRLLTQGNIQIFHGPSYYQFFFYPDFREKSPGVKGPNGEEIGNPFRKLAVRQALSLAVNREAIVKQVLMGYGRPANQVLQKGFRGNDASLPPLEHDPEKARQLLASAGYPKGFRLELYCSSDRMPNEVRICTSLAPMLTRIGITTTANPVPTAVLYPGLDTFKYSLVMRPWGMLSDEAWNTILTVVHTNDPARKYGVSNRTFYTNPTLDRLVEQAIATFEDNKRNEILREAVGHVYRDLPIIPIVGIDATWAGRKDLLMYEPRADDDTLAINLKRVR